MKQLLTLISIFAACAPILAECTYGEAITTQNYAVGVLLTWTTDQEVDNDRFQVELSTDGLEFRNIGTVLGRGTSLETNKYQYLHIQPKDDRLFYRLKQIDEDGTFSYSDIAIHAPNSLTPDLSVLRVSDVFAQQDIKLIFDAQQTGTVDCEIYNLSNRKVANVQSNVAWGVNEIDVPVGNLPEGIYRIQILYNGEVAETITFRRIPETDEKNRVPVARKN